MIDEQSIDVKPIKLRSEKDLNEEFEACNIALADTSLDWNKRVKALKRLEGIVIGGASEFESFPSFMAKLSPHLIAQLNDLRSIVSKEASNLICIAAKLAGQRLDTLCERLFSKEGLIKLINSGNKILSETGNVCIVNLITNVQSPKIIPRIVDELSSKNPSVREKASYYLTKLLSIYPAQVLEKQANVIESGIMAGVSDASKETRHHSRQAYFLYSQLFPQKTDKMYERLDFSVQKALQEDYGQEAIVPSMTKRSSCQEEPIAITKSKTPSRTPVTRKQVTEPVEPTELSKTEPKGGVTYGIEKKAGRPPTATKRKETETKEKEETPTNGKLSPERESTVTPDPSVRSKSQLTGSPSREQLKSSGSKRKGVGSTPSNKDNIQIRQSLDLSSTVTEGIMRSRKGKHPQTVTTQLIDLSSPTAKSEKILHNGHSNSENKLKVVQTYGIADEPEQPSTKHTSLQNLDAQEVGAKKVDHMSNGVSDKKMNQIKEPEITLTEEIILELIDKSSSESWTARAETFDKFAEYSKNFETQKGINNNLREQIIKAHVAHINDSHVKVALACMASLTKLAANMSNQVKGQLDYIIPALVKNLTDNREKVSNCSNFLMNVLQSTCTGEELLGPALKALETVKKTKDKVCLLELIGHIVTKCQFDSAGNIRQFVSKMAGIIIEYPNNSQVIMPILGSLLLLREKNHKATMSSIYQLPNNFQKAILIACSHHAPDLGESITAFMTEEQTKAAAKEEQKNMTPKGTSTLISFRRSDKENTFERHQQTQKKTTEKGSNVKDAPKTETTKTEPTRSETVKADSLKFISSPSPKKEELIEPLTPSQENKISAKVALFSKEKSKTFKMSSQLQLQSSDIKDVSSPSKSLLNSQKNGKKTVGQKLQSSQTVATITEQPQVSVFTLASHSKKVPSTLEEKLEFLKQNQTMIDNDEGAFESNLNQLNDIDIFSTGTRPKRLYDLETLEYLINNYQDFVEIWEGKTSAILDSLFQIIRESGPKVSELGLDLLTSSLNLPVDFKKNIDQLLRGLYSILPNYQKSALVDNIWNKLFSEELRDATMTQILNDLGGLDHPVVQIVIQQISIGLNDCSFEKAQKWLGNLTKVYQQLIQHSNPDIRKAIVFSLVDLNILYKEAFLPYMEGYNQSQQKLVVIYIKRKRDKIEGSAQK